jgi:hypothetical protein
MSCRKVVDFSGGQAGFVGMDFVAGILQNTFLQSI